MSSPNVKNEVPVSTQPTQIPGDDLKKNTQQEEKESLTGVGGWLLLLVAGMLVLGPLLGMISINTNIFLTENQYPELASLDNWKAYKVATWLIFFAVAAISFYGGWGLARGNDLSMVKETKAVLWITGPAASVVLGGLLPSLIFESNAVWENFIGAFIASIIAAAVWTAYLAKFKRVRNTYVIGDRGKINQITDKIANSKKLSR